ncbi:hypothetical protein Tco_0538535 [Tanacetum coccineum]
MIDGTSSEENSEQHSDLASKDEQEEKVTVYEEPSMYDNLLKTIRLASESIVDAYKMMYSLNSLHSYYHRYAIEFFVVAVTFRQCAEESKSDTDEDDEDEENDLELLSEHSEDDAEQSSDTDDGEEYTEKTSSIANELENSSSFSAHLDYKLLKEEIASLSTNKGKYNCEDSFTSPPDGLNQKLYDHWLNTYKPSGGQDLHSSRQRSFFSLCK